VTKTDGVGDLLTNLERSAHLQAFIAQQTITLQKLLNTEYVRSFGGLHRDPNPGHQPSQSTSLPLCYRSTIRGFCELTCMISRSELDTLMETFPNVLKILHITVGMQI
jgi:hypothetical protein